MVAPVIHHSKPAADIEIDESLVRALLREQHPDLAELPLQSMDSGWDNAMFRLGDSLAVRLPVRQLAAPLIEYEACWLPVIADALPVATPTPVFVGAPDDTYPWTWTVVRWIDGEEVAALPATQRTGLVTGLAETLLALHVPAPADAPVNSVRGVPLAARAETVSSRWPEVAPHVSAGVLEALRAWWSDGLAAAPWPAPPAWTHGDLHPSNLLHRDGRLTGVIDFGDITAGDPATDLAVAWWTFGLEDRAVFRRLLDASERYDADVWRRAGAWAAAFIVAVLCDPPSRTAFAPAIAHALDQLGADVPA